MKGRRAIGSRPTDGPALRGGGATTGRVVPERRGAPRAAGRRLAAAVALVLGAGCGPGGDTVDGVRVDSEAVRSALASIDSARIRSTTAFLSSDLMEGRAPGTRGGRLAAEYVASEFAALGLEPAGDGGFFQEVPIVGVTPRPGLTFTSEDGRVRYDPAYLEDFVAWTSRQRSSVDVTGELVFVGYGIHAPDAGWNDYAGVDVEGKVLLGLVNDPGSTGAAGFRGDTLTYFGRWTYKFEEAARRGAAAMLLVHTPESAGYGWSIVRNSWSGEQLELPVGAGERHLGFKGWLSEASARRLVELASVSLDSLVRSASEEGFRSRPLPLRAEGRVESGLRRLASPNVVAALPGRDTALRSQVVVYTSHYDHLGMAVNGHSEEDVIFNGAKDNASGVATLLEVARAYARMPERPRRTVLFAAVTAEESGLLGSQYLAEHPPTGRYVASVNMDAVNMYGRTRDLVQLGGEHSTLGATFRAVGDRLGFRVDEDAHPEQGYFFRSDQLSFVTRGIPAIYLEEGDEFVGEPAGTGRRRAEAYRRERYHQPDDEMLPAHTMGGAAQQAGAAFLLGWVVANAEGIPRWAPGSPFGGADGDREDPRDGRPEAEGGEGASGARGGPGGRAEAGGKR